MSVRRRARGSFLVLVAVARGAAAQSSEQAPALDVERYVALVLRAHPVAAQGAGLEAQAAAERRAAGRLPEPTFTYTRGRARPVERGAARATEQGYELAQALPWPGTLAARRRAGERAADVLRGEAAGLRWDLAADAREAFARLLAARELLALARDTEHDARALHDLLARRAEVGEARESDRLRAEVDWLRQQRGAQAAEREAAVAESGLRSLAVEPLPSPLQLEDARAAAPPAIAVDRGAALARLDGRQPALQAARAESGRREALASAARRARLPDLGLAFFRQDEIDRRATGVSIAVELPLWGARRAEIAQAEAARAVARAQAERLRLGLVAELDGRLAELELAAAQATLLEREVVPAARRGLALARLSFEEGETSLLDLLDAQRTSRDTRREAAQARLALALALAATQRLLGPDFDPWRAS